MLVLHFTSGPINTEYNPNDIGFCQKAQNCEASTTEKLINTLGRVDSLLRENALPDLALTKEERGEISTKP